MIDLRHLRSFIAVAETLHFGRAAERLHLTQPPLSRQIAALEKDLGVRLFQRGTRHTALTAAGEQFLGDARAVLASFEQACRTVRLVERGELGELSMAFMMHAAYAVLPSVVRDFTAAHPHVSLELREEIPSQILDAVCSGRYDAGITFRIPPVKGIAMHSLHHEPLCLAVPLGHRLASETVVKPSQLVGEALIAAPMDVSVILREAIVGYCRRGGVEPIIRLEAQLQQTIISLVGEQMGVALVPDSVRRLSVAGVTFCALAEPPVLEHVLLYRPANLNPTLRLLLQALKATVDAE